MDYNNLQNKKEKEIGKYRSKYIYILGRYEVTKKISIDVNNYVLIVITGNELKIIEI